MKLMQLKYFQAVCRYNSVTKAAKEMHISQPSMTNAIRALEDEFGVNLFYRKKKRLSLTKEGELFLAQTNDLLARSDAMAQQMQDIGAQKNNIRIGVPPMIGSILFPSMFQSFKEKFPYIHIDMREQGTSSTIRLVHEDSLDLALVITENVNQDLYHVEPIMTTEVVLAVSKDNPLANKPFIACRDLQDEPIVMFKEGYFLHKTMLERFKESGVEPDITLYSNQLYTMRQFISDNIASAFFVKELIENEEDIVGVPLEKPIKVEIGLIWKKGNYIYSDVAKFISFATEWQLSGR